MTGKYIISSKTAYAISLGIAALFLCNIYYQLHIAPGWQWGPAIDKMPKHMISDYLREIYDNGKGGYAATEYLDPKADIDRTAFPELSDGEPIKHTIRKVIGDGRTVAVLHDIEAARGLPARSVIDIFEVGARGGRLAIVKRYTTQTQE